MLAGHSSRERLRMVGRYVVQHEIASGGMATVYLGKLRGPVGFSPVVAVKALHPHVAKEVEFVRMFLDEARLAARVRHANIVPVIDVLEADDQLFLVLEYIHGESLSRLLVAGRREGRPAPPSVASAILCDVLHGLHAAHEAHGERGEALGIVHRDVSPHNVLVGVDGVARVFDFGIAKAAGRITTTREGHVKGKFAYMAPEQLRGESVNRQADVYSAAVVLWETLTGERLFKAESEGNTVARALFAPIPPPSSVRPDLPGAVDSVVMRGLARERSQRFATAKEMALALQSVVPPAPPTDVGEWVEANSFEALEERRRRIADLEASVASSDAIGGEAVASGLRPVPSAAGAPVDAAHPPAGTARARSSKVAVLTGAVLVAATVAGLWLRARSAPSLDAARSPIATASDVPTARGTPALATAVPEETPGHEGASPPVAPPSHAKSPSPSHPAVGRGKRTWSKPESSASVAPRCTRRNADGEIEFDIECLRETQRAP